MTEAVEPSSLSLKCAFKEQPTPTKEHDASASIFTASLLT